MVYFYYDHEAFADWNCNNKPTYGCSIAFLGCELVVCSSSISNFRRLLFCVGKEFIFEEGKERFYKHLFQSSC